MISSLSGRGRFGALGAFLLVVCPGFPSVGWAQQPGEQDYLTFCTACHNIGVEGLLGPDLAGVHDRRSQEWLMEFVDDSTSMIERGDPEAVALFEEYNSVPMPPLGLSEAQIGGILVYIESASVAIAAGGPPIVVNPPIPDPQAASAEPAVAAEAPVADPDAPLPLPPAEQIVLGQDLFQGRARFDNDGPTCNSCHEVVNDAVIGGGILAADLTTVFSRLGGPGVQVMVGTSPFPVMQAAYEEKALTADEVNALVSFLQAADQESAFQTPRDYGRGLFFGGVIGTAGFFGFCSILWRGRKRGSVNQTIYDRQVESIWEDQLP